MGNCVLKECGFQLPHQQKKKEKMFKKQLKEEYFSKMLEEHDTPHTNSNSKTTMQKSENNNHRGSKEMESELQNLEATPLEKKKEKQLKSALKNNNKHNNTQKIHFSSQNSTANQKADSPIDLSKKGFQNKNFVDEKVSSDKENCGNEYEQIFKDDIDSDDDQYIEKLFPEGSFKKKK